MRTELWLADDTGAEANVVSDDVDGKSNYSTGRQRIVEASELLGQLLLQDVECTEEGVSRDRIVSVHDPQMRHGHKSSSKRFDGHKMSVAVDTDSQVITAVDVLPGNASDNVGALELVERSEEGTVSEVEETIGDAAYGDGGTRQAFADAGRTLIAKLPRRPDSKRFPKDDFEARYFGRTKTLFQLLMAATVANLTLVAGKVGKMGAIYAGIISRPADFSLAGIPTARWSAIVLGQRLPLTLTDSVSSP